MPRRLAGKASPGGLRAAVLHESARHWVYFIVCGMQAPSKAAPSLVLFPCCSFRLPRANGPGASRLPPAPFCQLVEQLQACVNWRNKELGYLYSGAICMQGPSM